MRLTTTAAGGMAWTRSKYRIAAGRPLRFAMDLVAHAADWRAGWRGWSPAIPSTSIRPIPGPMGWPAAGPTRPTSGISTPTKLRRMAFRINWKCSEDFPYMGMFLPPLDRRTTPPGTRHGRAAHPGQVGLQFLQEPERLLPLDAARAASTCSTISTSRSSAGTCAGRPRRARPTRDARPLEGPQRFPLCQAPRRLAHAARTGRIGTCVRRASRWTRAIRPIRSSCWSRPSGTSTGCRPPPASASTAWTGCGTTTPAATTA